MEDLNYPCFLDGQTREAILQPVKRLHGKFTFEFRPMLSDEIEIAEFAMAKAGDKATNKTAVIHNVIARQLVRWSDPRPVTVATIKSLHPRLWNRIYLIIAGRDGGDDVEVPSDKNDTSDEFSELFVKAQTEGTSVALQREEATVKN